jgi:outer membrane protein W
MTFAQQPFTPNRRIRLMLTAPLLAAWLWSLYPLVTGWQPGTYLALIWVWALPPIMLQTFFFGDLNSDVFVPFAGIGQETFIVDLHFFACYYSGAHGICLQIGLTEFIANW